MKIERFEDIQARQNARILTKEIYTVFWNSKDRGFKDQICRASVSIGNNIAEGFERKSNNELRQFLYIAKWSSSEVRSMLYSAQDLWYISDIEFNKLTELSTIIAKQLSNFIKTL
jgi:four helix bundle protein